VRSPGLVASCGSRSLGVRPSTVKRRQLWSLESNSEQLRPPVRANLDDSGAAAVKQPHTPSWTISEGTGRLRTDQHPLALALELASPVVRHRGHSDRSCGALRALAAASSRRRGQRSQVAFREFDRARPPPPPRSLATFAMTHTHAVLNRRLTRSDPLVELRVRAIEHGPSCCGLSVCLALSAQPAGSPECARPWAVTSSI